MDRALHATCNRGLLAGLVLEQIHGMRGVVPQQVVGPAARLAQRIHVGATEEVSLHVHLQHLQFTGHDLLADPLVAGVEAARVAAHRDEPGALLRFQGLFRILEAVGQRDFHLHMLAGFQALDGLLRMHLRGRGEDHRIEAGLLEALGKIAGVMRNAEFLRDFPGGFLVATGERDDLDAGNLLDGLQMLDAERALSCQTYFHGMNLER